MPEFEPKLMVLAIAVLALAGCATQDQNDSSPEQILAVGDPDQGSANGVSDEIVAMPRPEYRRPRPEDYPAAAFDPDTLHELLAAELAVYRGELQFAAEEYARIAERTRDPGVAERATRLAQYLRRHDLALSAAMVWVQAAPEDAAAHQLAAAQLLRAGELEAATGHLAEVKSLTGEVSLRDLMYRSVILTRERRGTVIALLHRMHKADPGDRVIVYAMAYLYEQNGDLPNALDLLDQLLAAKPDDINVITLRVNVLVALDRGDEALRELELTLQAMPENRRLIRLYADILFSDKRYDDARIQYEKILAAAPSDGDALMRMARLALIAEDRQQARGYFQQMVRWNRRTATAHFYLGMLAEEAGDLPTAIQHYRNTDKGLEYVPAQFRLITILSSQGLVEAGRQHLQKQREQQPQHFVELIKIEAQLLRDHRQEEALFALMTDAISSAPDNIELLLFRAQVGEWTGRFEVFEQDLYRILELEPNNALVLNMLGYTLTDKTDRHEEALGLIRRALALKPDEAAYIDSMGWVQYRLKNFDEAIVHLRRALAMLPNDEVAAHLGEVLWVTGEHAEATAVWQQALEWKPDSSILKRVMERFINGPDQANTSLRTN